MVTRIGIGVILGG